MHLVLGGKKSTRIFHILYIFKTFALGGAGRTLWQNHAAQERNKTNGQILQEINWSRAAVACLLPFRARGTARTWQSKSRRGSCLSKLATSSSGPLELQQPMVAV